MLRPIPRLIGQQTEYFNNMIDANEAWEAGRLFERGLARLTPDPKPVGFWQRVARFFKRGQG